MYPDTRKGSDTNVCPFSDSSEIREWKSTVTPKRIRPSFPILSRHLKDSQRPYPVLCMSRKDVSDPLND